jgi:hypothetical protein
MCGARCTNRRTSQAGWKGNPCEQFCCRGHFLSAAIWRSRVVKPIYGFTWVYTISKAFYFVVKYFSAINIWYASSDVL